jgi:hypothetical protein
MARQILTDEKKERNRVRAKAWARANPKRNCQRSLTWARENKDKRKIYRQKRRAIILEQKRIYRQKHREQIKEAKRKFYEVNRTKVLKECQAYVEKNREKVTQRQNGWARKRRATDPIFRLWLNLRSTHRRILRYGGSKIDRDLIGCDKDWLIAWLQIQFQPGMAWDNYGSAWHVDHKQPLASFTNLIDPNQQRRACHWTNLQPLWAAENLSKGAKWDQAAA